MTLIRSDDTTLVENSRNRFLNPVISGTSTGGFTVDAGTGGVAAVSHAAGITPPVGIPATRAVRATWSIAPTGGFPGLLAPRVAVTPGEVLPYRLFARRATAGVLRCRVFFYKTDGTAAAAALIAGTSPTMAATAWHEFRGALTIPPECVQVAVNVTFASAELPAATSWIGVTVMTTDPAGLIFDGSTPASGDRSYTWAGTPNASESIEWLAVPVVNITPLMVEGFEYARSVRSILHPILGNSEPDVTFRPGGLRTGSMTLVMSDSAAAQAAVAGLFTPRVFTLEDPDVPEIGMRFVVADDDVTARLDPVTRKRWLVTVPFQEVS